MSSSNNPNRSENLQFIQEILAQSRKVPAYLHKFIVVLYVLLGVAAFGCHFIYVNNPDAELLSFDIYWGVVAVLAFGIYIAFRIKYRKLDEPLVHMIERRGRTYFLMVVLALVMLNIFYYKGIITEKLHLMPFVMLGFGMSAPILSLRVFSWDVLIGLLWYSAAMLTAWNQTMLKSQFLVFAAVLLVCAAIYSSKFRREAISS